MEKLERSVNQSRWDVHGPLLLRWRQNILATLVACFAVPAVAAPLSFEEAMQLAERNAPSLAADNARIEAARQSAILTGGVAPLSRTH